MSEGKIDVLFLCAHNSARSIMAEAILRRIGSARFRAHSAGLRPADEPHPLAMEVLVQASVPTAGLHSKHLEVYRGVRDMRMDLVVTLCPDTATEVAFGWPGTPALAAWEFPDPLEATGPEPQRKEAFRHVLHELRKRLEILVNLPEQGLERLKLQQAMRELAQA